jgi:hypothetical protein
VWALRAQTDKLEYAAEMRRVLEATPNLYIREAMVTGECWFGVKACNRGHNITHIVLTQEAVCVRALSVTGCVVYPKSNCTSCQEVLWVGLRDNATNSPVF